MNEWPEIVIVMLTWCGPADRNIGEARLGYLDKTLDSLQAHFHYPNYTWHVADDGSGPEYQKKVLSRFESRICTFSDTKADGDVGYNINMGLREAFKRTDIVALWHDDRWLADGLDIKTICKLLREDKHIGLIRLKPGRPLMIGTKFERYGQEWMHVEKRSRCAHLVDIGPLILHKRFIDAYGLWPSGLRPPRVDDWIDLRVRRIAGPRVVAPGHIWKSTEIPWGGDSTWE